MGIRYEWSDEEEIVLIAYIEYPWTWAEHLEKLESIFSVVKEKKTPCAIVVDMTKMQSIPRDGNMLQILLYTDKVMPSNVFAIIMVGANPIAAAFMNVVTKLRPTAKRVSLFTRNLDEAYRLAYKRYTDQYPHLPVPKHQPKEG